MLHAIQFQANELFRFRISSTWYTKCRNQLQSEKVNKLTCVYINACILKHQKSQLSILSTHTMQSPMDLTEAELVQLEDELMEDETRVGNRSIRAGSGP